MTTNFDWVPDMKLFALLLLLSVHYACRQSDNYDLVIRNAKLFDSRSGKISSNCSILIKAGRIASIDFTEKDFPAKQTIDAKGKLVTPGFIDTHIHPTDVFGDYDAAPEHLAKDSLPYLRKQLSDDYLPYGVTTAMIMGQPENWLPPILDWIKNPDSRHVDLLTTGGAIISNEDRKPYVAHVEVESPANAREKVIQYYRQGIRHIKLYWRLRPPEYEAALKAADSLGIRIYTHVDANIMTIDSTLSRGVRHYEHTLTLDNSVLVWSQDNDPFTAHMRMHYGQSNVSFPAARLEMFRYIHENKRSEINTLIERLAQKKATFSTTIHLMGEQFGVTYFSNTLDTTLTATQLARCKENFKIFMAHNKQLHDRGVKLRIGTDGPNGGKMMQSEQLLMFEHGFPISAILQISTISGAEALGLDKEVGSIEQGKKANLVIFEKSPFDDYRNFLAAKIVIKDGVVL
jgi:imidazolonepropionase-like amidohydrolase